MECLSGCIRASHAKGDNITSHAVDYCFCFPSQSENISNGDVTGRVLVWKDIGNGEVISVKSEDDPESCTTFNWHSAKVTLLNFSSDGALLYSGIKEGDLVVWELDTGKKQHLPKIGSPSMDFIFSSDPTLSSVICADNQIHLLKMPSMEILRTISGIKPPRSERMGFIFYLRMRDICLIRTVSIDRSSGIPAFCTSNHRVQLYNLLSDHEISEVQVCERNHHPDDDEVRVLVTAVALSRNGSVMSTAEARFAATNFSEGLVSLKFWVFVPDSKTFSCSTVINQPHRFFTLCFYKLSRLHDFHRESNFSSLCIFYREAAITAIALNPARSMAVSISSAGDFQDLGLQ